MANGFELISTVTVGSGGAASIDFNSIAGTFTDLLIKISVRESVSSGSNIRIIFNSDTGANYQNIHLFGNGSSGNSLSNSGSGVRIGDYYVKVPGAVTTSNTFGNMDMYIPNYAGSTQKSVSIDSVSETNATEAYQSLDAALWTGTSAISAISIKVSNTLAQYSTASLYGILKGSGGATVS